MGCFLTKGKNARFWRRGFLRKGGSTLTVTISGLSSNAQYTDYALTDDHTNLGATMSDASTITAYKWGSTPGGIEYGTAAAPTTYTAADTADPDAPATLYLTATAGGIDYTTTAKIRKAIVAFSVQPTFSGTFTVGQTITVNDGTATGATIENYALSLDGVSKLGDMSGDTWNTTGESVYGADGLVSAQKRAVTSGGVTLSNVITETLTDVPDQFASGGWSVAA